MEAAPTDDVLGGLFVTAITLSECLPFAALSHEPLAMNNLRCELHLRLRASPTVFSLADGSAADSTTDAIVNSANEGCLTGGGIDGVLTSMGGASVVF